MHAQGKSILKTILTASVEAVLATSLYEKYLHVYDDALYYKNTFIDLAGPGKLVFAGSGKASLAMGNALRPYLTRPIDDSLFISPSEAPESPFCVIRGNHPLPKENSLKAGNRMLDLIEQLTEDDTLLYFLSGGSSALMEAPVNGISAEDLQSATDRFLADGLSIREINTLRAAFSKVKAGKLASICQAKCYVFVLSDVMGNDLSMIGSGPFYPRRGDPAAIDALIERYRLESNLPPHMIDILRAYRPDPGIREIPHYLIGSNMDMLEAAELTCMDHGIKPLSFPESLFGEAQQAGKMIADMIKFYSGPKPVCMIFGGETTVTLNESPGQGGRSQELALSALEALKDMKGITLLAAGSDGMDGVGGAAGAIVNAETYQKALDLGLSIPEYLDRHDAYHFHDHCGSLITTGYSGTNVGDVVLALKVES